MFHYQNYSDKRGNMEFDRLINFYKDFEIFPDIISLTQIKNIFNYLSEMFVEEEKNMNKTKSNFNFIN